MAASLLARSAGLLLLLLLAGAEHCHCHCHCHFTGPVDLTRTVDSSSVAVATPFTSGSLIFYSNNESTASLNDFCIGEHTGTHLDAPFHFNNDSWTVEQIPVERLVANGVFLNVTEEVAGDPSFQLQPEHIERWIQQHGDFPDNAVLLVSFGWAQRYHNRSLYLGTDATELSNYRQPGISPAAADRLATLPQLVGLGVDTASIDPPGRGYAHALLARANVYNLEHVALDPPCLPARGFTLLALPMKLAAGTGAPVRVVAVPGAAHAHAHAHAPP